MKASATSGGIEEDREHFKAHTVKLAMVWAGAELTSGEKMKRYTAMRRWVLRW